jgi:hypothetical protein
MAKLVQSIFDEELDNDVHSDIPYNSVYIVCQSIYPEIIADKNLLISICLCSLHYHNPGAGFFEVINIHKANPEFDGRDLYRHMCLTSRIIYNGENLRIRDLLIKRIEQYEINIKASIIGELEYFSYVFKNIILDTNRSEHHLLNVLYNDELNKIEKAHHLLDHYGIPFIEANDITIMAKLPEQNATYNDLANLLALELVITRFIPKKINGERIPYDPKCPMFAKCHATIYNDQVAEEDKANMSESCNNKQWQQEEVCLMRESLRKYDLNNKEIIQDSLPREMR